MILQNYDFKVYFVLAGDKPEDIQSATSFGEVQHARVVIDGDGLK